MASNGANWVSASVGVASWVTFVCQSDFPGSTEDVNSYLCMQIVCGQCQSIFFSLRNFYEKFDFFHTQFLMIYERPALLTRPVYNVIGGG